MEAPIEDMSYDCMCYDYMNYGCTNFDCICMHMRKENMSATMPQ